MNSVSERGLIALAEDKMKVLENLDVRTAKLFGWSFGARLALEVGRVGSDSVDIVRISSDEPPSEIGRDRKALRKDFMKSGGFPEQTEAVDDASIPALSETYSRARLAWDYLKFGLASITPHNKALHEAMTGDISEVLNQLRTSYPDTTVKIGSVEGSRIFADDIDLQAVNRRHYTGLYMHASSNNPYVNAAITGDGLLASH